MSASARLVRLLTKREHLLWAERVKPHLPHCVTMHNNLVQHGLGLVCHATFYVLRDRPHSLTVLCRNEIIPHTQHIGVFCLKEEVSSLVEALRSSPIIDWEYARRTHLVHYVPPYTVEPLVKLVQERGVKVWLQTCFTFIYDAHLDPHTLRVPAGFRVCRLGRAGVRHLLENAKYGGIPLDLMYRMAEGVPYIGVYQDPTSTQEATVDPENLPVAGDEEIPVAWCCSGHLGDVAKLITDKRFRRHGFGKLLTATLARRQAALGFIPHAFVEEDNSVSKVMFENSPGWSVTHEIIWIKKLQAPV
uniref:GCN5-related N-acetyltransferase Rv2170-like domain-containing protein n=2 Tax=Scylla olivacea TaxID=85551 RepID=A0A0P4VZ02_SCYOL